MATLPSGNTIDLWLLHRLSEIDAGRMRSGDILSDIQNHATRVFRNLPYQREHKGLTLVVGGLIPDLDGSRARPFIAIVTNIENEKGERRRQAADAFELYWSMFTA